MEDTFIVIMLKNSQTGFLETELGSCRVDKYENLIYNIYAVETEPGIEVHMKLCADRELADWEFEAVLDYYDGEVFEGIGEIREDDEGYDPIWEIIFPYKSNEEELEKVIENILEIHQKELYDVYEAIKGLEEEYK